MEIKIHSNLKHKALGYYLKILKDVIMSPTTPFDKLYYCELYCGDGTCEVTSINQHYDPPLIESVLKEAENGRLDVECYLNDIDSEKIKLLKQKVEPYKKFIKEISCEDANKCVDNILSQIPADQISLFVLDPFNHKHLNFETISKISKHTSEYLNKRTGDKEIRRPELIVNCMAYSMINCYRAGDYKSITKALGTDKWTELIPIYKEKGVSMFKVFLDVLIEQLKSLGYSIPPPLEIKSTIHQNDIYYLVWATNEAGCRIIEKKVITPLKKFISKSSEDNKKVLVNTIKRQKAIGRGESLDKWF